MTPWSSNDQSIEPQDPLFLSKSSFKNNDLGILPAPRLALLVQHLHLESRGVSVIGQIQHA